MIDSYNLYTYIEQLYRSVQLQMERISELETSIAAIQQDLLQLKKEKAVHIDKIEYHFDQLKVETLEGTLNIGFSPNTIGEQVEDLMVNGQEIEGEAGSLTPGTPEEPPKTQAIHPTQTPAVGKLMKRMEAYLNREFANDIQSMAMRYQLPIDPDFYPMIHEEIKDQIEPRIRFYLKQVEPLYGKEDRQDWEEQIFAQTKQDILVAIENFVRSLKQNK